MQENYKGDKMTSSKKIAESRSNKQTSDFEPFILGIFCNWCTYTGADQAGTSRMQRPANLRVLRVMCSGRVQPEMVIEALKRGADGVLIGACHVGDCHYVSGNHKTVRRIPLLQEYLTQMGFHPLRLRLEHISASEGAELTEIVKDYVEKLKKLGPNPMKTS